VLEQIGVNPAHIIAGGWKHKWLGFLLPFRPHRLIYSPVLTIEQLCHRFRIAHTVKPLQKGDGPAALLLCVVVPLIAADRNAVVAGETLLMTGGEQLLSLAEQKLLQVHLTGTALLVFCEMYIRHCIPPCRLDFLVPVLYNNQREGWRMQVAVLNGTLSEAEQDFYIRHVMEKYPVSIVEKIILDVHTDYVDVSYTLHRFRDLRKMGGYCIGEPSD